MHVSNSLALCTYLTNLDRAVIFCKVHKSAIVVRIVARIQAL